MKNFFLGDFFQNVIIISLIAFLIHFYPKIAPKTF